ncbi:MAG: ABC-F family ATP-binding cassette domain-containing protein [Mycoplasmatales bacterium]
MIKIENISKSFGQDYVFKDISFVINSQDKIGIVGKNGQGKTTLLKSIIFEEFLNSGEVDIQGSIGYLEQTSLKHEEYTLYEEYLELFPELQKINAYLKQTEYQTEDHEKYIKYEEQFSIRGGYEFQTKLNKFLTGFGFQKSAVNKKVKEFSGGEKTKLSLIKLLLLNPDYLFLDEPTNHLDINTIWWLENYLKSLKKSIIIVSHDRMFLDNICNKIIEIENQNIEIYKTNFSNYLKQKVLNYNLRLNEYHKNQKLIAKYEEYIIKNRQTPSKIGQVNDRKRKLEQLKVIEEPKKNYEKISFEFTGYHLKKAPYIDFFDVVVGYEQKPLIKDFNFRIYGGDKVAIIGKNGEGKTTLFKAILDKSTLISGKIKVPAVIKIGYFDQEQKMIDINKTLYDIIDEKGKFASTTAIRKYLGQFLFKGQDVFKKVEELSGGQKVRLALATMALESYDILLLDEPTNHLDFETKDILQQTLKNFPGSLIFITHDRTLINELADNILEVENNKINIWPGNWDYYVQHKKNDLKEQKVLKVKQVEKKQKENNSQNNKDSKNNSNKKNINTQKIKILEEKLLKLEEQKEDYLTELLKKENLQNYENQKIIQNNLNKLQQELDEVYKEYENSY